MKIRSGFVSNSSTSSFVLVGWKITEDVEKFAKRYIATLGEFQRQEAQKAFESHGVYGPFEYGNNSPFTLHTPDDGDTYLFGFYRSFPEDEWGTVDFPNMQELDEMQNVMQLGPYRLYGGVEYC